MVIYVALIAILNLGLGYALAVYLGAGRQQLAAADGTSPLGHAMAAIRSMSSALAHHAATAPAGLSQVKTRPVLERAMHLRLNERK